MLEFIFTLDYEIYGNGSGSLGERVVEPTERLRSIFREFDATMVIFAEVAELESIEDAGADKAIHDARAQLRALGEQGFELGLHLHPQWYKARRSDGRWMLNMSEYSLCSLPEARIDEMIGRGIGYLRGVLAKPNFTPVSFRAGNWLLQPSGTVARVLGRHGIRVDSSVFKGGVQRQHGLDYRPALRNGWHWTFTDDVNVMNPHGLLLEVPIYTEMVPCWKMLRARRLGLQRRDLADSAKGSLAKRIPDLLRFRYPLKLDFCRMASDELRGALQRLVRADAQQPEVYRPVVAIGHSKDLPDADPIRECLSFLRERGIPIIGFQSVYKRLKDVPRNAAA